MSAYYILEGDDARRYLEARDTDDPIPIDDVQRITGSGTIVDLGWIDQLWRDLDMIRSEFPLELRQRDQAGRRFEQLACPVVHQAMTALPSDVLANPNFWTWLAVAKFSDIIEWRFGSDSKPASLDNYGIGKRVENLLYRLWIRADIGYDPAASDPYGLANGGDQDLWRSHIIRQRYSNARHLARALLKLQAGALGRQRLNRAGIRELAKRLRRLSANVLFEVLDASQSDRLILELSMDL